MRITPAGKGETQKGGSVQEKNSPRGGGSGKQGGDRGGYL